MPQFNPGQSKNAVVPVTVQPSGLSCEIEVFLGPNDTTKVATSGLLPFTSTGSQQGIVAPITMPSASGTYHVFIDVYCEDFLIAAYQAIEDVVIATVGVAEFTYVSSVRILAEFYNAYAGGPEIALGVDIKNIGTVAGEVTITGMYRLHFRGWGIDRWDTYACSWSDYPDPSGGWFLLSPVYKDLWYQDPPSRRRVLQPGEVWTARWKVFDYRASEYYPDELTWCVSEAGRTEDFVVKP